MRVDKIGGNNGHVAIETETTEITVGQRYFMKIIYTAGSDGIHEGGSLRFLLPGLNLNEYMTAPVRCSNPEVEIACSNRLPEVNGKNGSEFFTIDYLFVTLKTGNLKEGDTVTVSYGENLAAKNICAPSMAQKWRVEVATDLTGKREAPGSGFYLVRDCPVLDFVGDRVAKLEVTIPAATVKGMPFRMAVRAKDRYENPASHYAGKVRLYVNKPDEAFFLGSLDFSPGDGSVRISENHSLAETGINRVIALDEDNGLFARSNPSRTSQECAGLNVYWGDTHCHSSVSADEAASGTINADPDAVYSYAKGVSALDFCMVTDHSEDLCDEDWQKIRKAAADNYEPGRFVTFSAYEATHRPLRKCGDKNVYFMGDDTEYISQGTPEDLFKGLKKYGDKAMVIPHMHMATDWAAMDFDLVKVAEIYSHWGCGLSQDSGLPIISGARMRLKKENYVGHILERGAKVGFIASADHSFGHPGDDFWWSLSSYNGGLAGICAERLTREDIWGALVKRHCYATTRARILLEFFINGAMMGDEVNLSPDTGRSIKIGISGTAAIEKVKVVKNGRTLFSSGSQEFSSKLDAEICYNDNCRERDVDYYYLHVTQEDGEQAWSSPIWVRQ